ncbi:MAG: hypothetical protein HYY20_10090, partial [Candidatus Tectomicrobia bacterium]|nr:hypothetical protein [Candidatus Tectomicrobia bacterium]
MRTKSIFVTVSVLVAVFSSAFLASGNEVLTLKNELKKQRELTEKLLKRIEELEKKVERKEAKEKEETTGGSLVNLEEEESVGLKEETSTKIFFDKRWFERFDIGGVASARYMDSENKGTNPRGGFQLWEARPFIEAEVWENISFFLEADLVKYAKPGTWLGSGEVYFNFRNLLGRWGWEKALNVKIGRMDIPFGEEYLWNDSFDNPLISHSANWPYGYDEGILFYGIIGPMSYMASVMDGNISKEGPDDTSDKSFSIKFYGDLLNSLHLSASFMRTGKLRNYGREQRGMSALIFAGSYIAPLEDDFEVRANLYELNARYSHGPA